MVHVTNTLQILNYFAVVLDEKDHGDHEEQSIVQQHNDW